MAHLHGRTDRGRLQARNLQGRRRILIADDDPGLRSLLRAVFRNDGHDTVEACDGAEAAAFIDESLTATSRWPEFDAVVSDVQMPKRSGLEVLAGLSGCPTAPPVVLMTAFVGEELRLQATRLGAIAVLDKPFDLDVLKQALEVAFRRSDAREPGDEWAGHEHA